eukprot:Gb_11183 [translate_table: standard]
MAQSLSTQPEKKLIIIDITSDTVCPWCFVGKRHLDKAMNASKDLYDFQVRWHPFLLNPSAPKEGIEKSIYYKQKFGEDRVKLITSRVIKAFQDVGVDSKSGGLTGNTLDSHRLIEFAAQQGLEKQNALVEELFLNFFTEEKYIAFGLGLEYKNSVMGLPLPPYFEDHCCQEDEVVIARWNFLPSTSSLVQGFYASLAFFQQEASTLAFCSYCCLIVGNWVLEILWEKLAKKKLRLEVEFWQEPYLTKFTSGEACDCGPRSGGENEDPTRHSHICETIWTANGVHDYVTSSQECILSNGCKLNASEVYGLNNTEEVLDRSLGFQGAALLLDERSPTWECRRSLGRVKRPCPLVLQQVEMKQAHSAWDNESLIDRLRCTQQEVSLGDEEQARMLAAIEGIEVDHLHGAIADDKNTIKFPCEDIEDICLNLQSKTLIRKFNGQTLSSMTMSSWAKFAKNEVDFEHKGTHITSDQEAERSLGGRLSRIGKGISNLLPALLSISMKENMERIELQSRHLQSPSERWIQMMKQIKGRVKEFGKINNIEKNSHMHQVEEELAQLLNKLAACSRSEEKKGGLNKIHPLFERGGRLKIQSS